MHSLVKRKICLVENIFVEKNQSAGDDFMGDTIFGKYIYIFFFFVRRVAVLPKGISGKRGKLVDIGMVENAGSG